MFIFARSSMAVVICRAELVKTPNVLACFDLLTIPIESVSFGFHLQNDTNVLQITGNVVSWGTSFQ